MTPTYSEKISPSSAKWESNRQPCCKYFECSTTELQQTCENYQAVKLYFNLFVVFYFPATWIFKYVYLF